MKAKTLFTFLVTLLLLMSCNPALPPDTGTQHPSRYETGQPLTEYLPVPAQDSEPFLPLDSSVISSECSTQERAFLTEIPFSGSIVLENRASDSSGRWLDGDFLLRMEGGLTNLWESLNDDGTFFVTSPDHTLIALRKILFEADELIKEELVILDARGEVVFSSDWKDEWNMLLFWQDKETLIFNLSKLEDRQLNLLTEPGPIGIYNFRKDEQQTLFPNFSEFVQPINFPGQMLPRNVLPTWNGQYGVVYDPALTRAIYLRYMQDREVFTYGIWDIENDRLAGTLDAIYRNFTVSEDIRTALMPHWSPDGSDFLIVSSPFFIGESGGEIDWDTEYLEMELYRVNRAGGAEKLTHLNPTWSVEDFNLSWSPDVRYVAMFVRPYYGPAEKIRLAVLDMQTLKIMDTCIDIGHSTQFSPPRPIWSPNSKQFLVWDQVGDDLSQVILYDVDRKAASILVENMEPVGWLFGGVGE
jgi:hypothetical protein